MATDDSARDKLVERHLVQLELSDALNPLTAPAVLPADLSPAERAQKRFGLEGNAIVTGGAGGIVLIVVRALLEHGASGIAIFDVPGSLSNGAAEISKLKVDFPRAKIVIVEVDVRDEAKVDAAVREAVGELNSVEMLLCLAGVVQNCHAHEMTGTEWRRVLDVNTSGSWFCAQAVGKQMIAQGKGGSIILTASVSGHRANFPQPQVAYNTSKAAVLQIARCLAAEWARFGIRVNSVSPGYMDTILNHGDGLAECRRIWTSRTPAGRMGNPEELTGVIVMLFSPVAGKFINGADILVDGGLAVLI